MHQSVIHRDSARHSRLTPASPLSITVLSRGRFAFPAPDLFETLTRCRNGKQSSAFEKTAPDGRSWPAASAGVSANRKQISDPFPGCMEEHSLPGATSGGAT